MMDTSTFLDRLLGSQGRYGDTLVAHISPAEAEMLKRHGGSGTVNPRTGLLEFFGAEGGMGAHGRSQGDRGGMGGGAGGGASRSGVGGENSAAGSLGAGYRDSSYGGSYTGGGGLRGAKNEHAAIGTLGGNTAIRDAMETGKIGVSADANSNGAFGKFASAWAKQLADEADEGEGFFTKLANALLNGTLSVTERAMVDPADPFRDTAQWGFDAPGFIGGILGSVMGGPGLGMVTGYGASQLAKELGNLGFIGFNGQVGGFGSAGSLGGSSTSNGTSSGGGDIGQGNGAGHAGDQMPSPQTNNAGGGLVAALSPTVPTPNAGTTPMPDGLLAYLSRIGNRTLPGYAGNTRFGQGTVAPITYGTALV